MVPLLVLLVVLVAHSSLVSSQSQDPRSPLSCLDKVFCPNSGDDFLSHCLKGVASATDPLVASMFSAAGADGVNLRQPGNTYCQANNRTRILSSFLGQLKQKKASCTPENKCKSYSEHQKRARIFEIFKDAGDIYHVPGLFSCDLDLDQFATVYCGAGFDTNVALFNYNTRSVQAEIPKECLSDSSGCSPMTLDQVLTLNFDLLKDLGDQYNIPGMYSCNNNVTEFNQNWCSLDKQGKYNILDGWIVGVFDRLQKMCTPTSDCSAVDELQKCLDLSWSTTKRFGIC